MYIVYIVYADIRNLWVFDKDIGRRWESVVFLVLLGVVNYFSDEAAKAEPHLGGCWLLKMPNEMEHIDVRVQGKGGEELLYAEILVVRRIIIGCFQCYKSRFSSRLLAVCSRFLNSITSVVVAFVPRFRPFNTLYLRKSDVYLYWLIRIHVYKVTPSKLVYNYTVWNYRALLCVLLSMLVL